MKNTIKFLLIPSAITCLYICNSSNTVAFIRSNDNFASNAIDCTYRLVFKLDTVANHPLTEYFKLLISGNTSQFKSKRQILSDSIFSVYDSMPFNQEVADNMTNALSKAPRTEFSYEVYKNATKKVIDYVDEIDSKKYFYSEPESIFEWQITPNIRTISGYKCQQAITFFRGRHYTAWFTRQIPISDGPYKFCGLPGLIIQIQDKSNDYNFELVSLRESKSGTLIDLPNKVIGTTRKNFLQGITDYNNSFIERATQNKITFSNPELARKTFQENLNRRNNPIELR